MKRSHALILSGAAFLAVLSSPTFAQTARSGMQCVPDVANTSMYQNCHLRIVAGEDVCRCAIRPQALRRTDHIRNQEQDDIATGSINRGSVLRGDQFGEGTLGTDASVGRGSLGGGTNGNGTAGGTAGGGTTGSGSSGAVADNGGTSNGGYGNNGYGNGGGDGSPNGKDDTNR